VERHQGRGLENTDPGGGLVVSHRVGRTEDGETVVLAAGAEFKILARNPLNERCQASLAVSGGRLFIRTDKHLVCLR
jgi:hypothetical protein